jgi:hypothetical protein
MVPDSGSPRFGCATGKVQAGNHHDICSNADADEKIEIYYGEDGLEIGGVNGAVEDWREILLPLLLIKHRKMENSKTRKRERNES